MAGEDAANDALIARLMAEEYYGGQEWEDPADDSDDPDFGAERAKKGKKGGGSGKRGGRKSKARAAEQPAQPAAAAAAPAAGAPVAATDGQAQPQPAAPLDGAEPAAGASAPASAAAAEDAAAGVAAAEAGAGPGTAAGGDELSITGRKKRKDTGKQRTSSRSWSEEEERLFQEALALHGRDWKKCAEHVGTRDPRAITSHAQKHFIKLLLRGEEVPGKVAETGRGYTLSGKPLDPNSSSAQAYGLKPELFEAVCQRGLLVVGVHVTTLEMSGDALAARRAATIAKKASGGGSSPGSSGPAPKRQRRGRGRQGSEDLSEEEEGSDDEALAAALAASAAMAASGERTEYARNRPRREVGQRARLGETTESLELTHLQAFVGPPGTGAPLAQPFSVRMESQALLVADFHAHLSRCEVIGLLGGTFDAERRVMEIKEAFPCKRAAGSESSTSVELDAESQVEAISAMEERELIPVGWYHSHPIFEPRPSAKDNENQRNYQALCRDASTGLEPWVGLIVGPYDQALESPASQHQMWVVRPRGGAGGTELVPYLMRHLIATAMPAEHVQEKVAEALDQLVEDVGRVDLAERWRGFASLVGGQPVGGPLTKIQKLWASLAQHLPRDQPAEVASFLDTVTRSIETAWGVSLAAAVAAGAEVAGAAGGEALGGGKQEPGVGVVAVEVVATAAAQAAGVEGAPGTGGAGVAQAPPAAVLV